MGIVTPPTFEGQRLEGTRLPPRLRELPEPPDRLFLHGALPAGPCVGVVGTRHPTPEAIDYAEHCASSLAARGVAIISGGAKGIDAAAHRGALSASGLTLVVAGSSLDRPFPASHAALYAEVLARGGGYLSRFETGIPARPHHFLERNAILVALCDALIVVEAPVRSGARSAARWARQLTRPCFVVPSAPWNEKGRGCILELQLGARALAGPSDVLEWLDDNRQLPILPQPAAPPAGPSLDVRPSVAAGRGEGTAPASAPAAPPHGRADADDIPAAILGAIERGARYADEVAQALGVGLPSVNHALLLLTLSGDVHQGPGGALTRAPR